MNTLGGSRAEGTDGPDSDWDLAVYHLLLVQQRELFPLAHLPSRHRHRLT